ncbi:MAG: hypothetical protein M1816_000619 [Peltula sp. TS41687]|nr:MAG: hypothetical protein M1816_000619 [Peltula sp. TS41687]
MRRNAHVLCVKANCECQCHLGGTPGPIRSGDATSTRSDSGFPFLKLPAEIRNMVYQWLLLPAGDQRLSPYYVGKVHLPILQTCQQIYQEARAIPLSRDTLWFPNQVQAHIFLYRFLKHPHLSRITSMHLDLDQEEIGCAFFPFLCEDHARLLPSLNRLVITVKGKINESILNDDSTFIRGLQKFNGLNSFELELPYLGVPQRVKDEAVARFKQRLVTKQKDDTPVAELVPAHEASAMSEPEGFRIETHGLEDNIKAQDLRVPDEWS